MASNSGLISLFRSLEDSFEDLNFGFYDTCYREDGEKRIKKGGENIEYFLVKYERTEGVCLSEGEGSGEHKIRFKIVHKNDISYEDFQELVNLSGKNQEENMVEWLSFKEVSRREIIEMINHFLGE